jgi:WhiB family transcriptional regulator, redox-sensing transcriptional regulator
MVLRCYPYSATLGGRRLAAGPDSDGGHALALLPADGPDLSPAACRTVDPDTFFPELFEEPQERAVVEREALAVCRSCPVREACLTAALERREDMGVWGGLTTRQRGKLVRRRTARAGVAA